MAQLTGKTVAVIVHNYFEQVELTSPKEALEAAGATVHIIATQPGEVQGMNSDVNKADTFPVDATFRETNPDDYDALVVPGGTVNADKLRVAAEAQAWLKTCMAAGKPTAVICHGPWLIISSGIARGKKLTSYYTLKDDLVNAGAEWADEAAVVDGSLITSRSPDDLPAFNEALIVALAKETTPKS